MKYAVFLMLLLINHIIADAQINGVVISSESSNPIAFASLKMLSSGTEAMTDETGRFSIAVNTLPDTLSVHAVGYHRVKIILTERNGTKTIHLRPAMHEIEEVMVYTGYQTLPKERSTGSFTSIDQKLIQRSFGQDILSRLEGVANGVAFELPSTSSRGEPSSNVNLRVRGIGTIRGTTEPLIVVDNFPYEGDIRNINPNDVLNITILKDAAAASIWGARAGNGVIVINTKNGAGQSKTRLEGVLNTTIAQKPDLLYSRIFLPPTEAIELERKLFEMGRYQKNDWTALPPAVEVLIAQSEGRIDEVQAEQMLANLKEGDIREEAARYLYRSKISQQYALSARGGSDRYSYYLSGGFDRDQGPLVGNRSSRLTTSSKMDFRPTDRLTVGAAFHYALTKGQANGIGLTSLSPASMTDPYVYGRLADKNGDALPLVKNNRITYTERALQDGLLDWQYRPLEELGLVDNTSTSQEVRLNTHVEYKVVAGLKVEARHQYQNSISNDRQHYLADSYYVRHLVNQFTQLDGRQIVPEGGILDRSSSTLQAHYGRAQLSYTKDWSKHSLNGLAGFEIRQERNVGLGSSRLYGYDDDVLTHIDRMDFTSGYPTRPRQSASLINTGNTAGRSVTDRFVSYYANMGYSFDRRYLASASIRWDASNIFGVDFNQKGVPLWSSGLAWNLAEESFFQIDWVDRVKLRATYGANGNIVSSLSATPYVSYGFNNATTGMPMALLGSVGNPDLSWEQINTINLGADIAILKNRLALSLEWYQKKAKDLIGEDVFDPTVGIIPAVIGYNLDNRRNYADLMTKGLDIALRVAHTRGRVKWDTHYILNIVNNKVTNFHNPAAPKGVDLFGSVASRPLLVGNPIDQVYALPWYGLDPGTGAPLVMVDGTLGMDYNRFFNELTVDDLLRSGVTMPTHIGAVRNTVQWGSLTLDMNVTFKFGAVFRRESLNYGSLFGNTKTTNIEYLSRWQQPGDERYTDVPSMPSASNTRRDQAYIYSEAAVESSDHIRLQDINIAYRIPSRYLGRLGISQLQFVGYAKNVGILWKRTRQAIDPDVRALYPRPIQFSIGLQIQL